MITIKFAAESFPLMRPSDRGLRNWLNWQEVGQTRPLTLTLTSEVKSKVDMTFVVKRLALMRPFR